MNRDLTMGSVDPPVAAIMTAQRRPTWATWLIKSLLAISDQGITTGANFLVSVCLARWLVPKQYGAYALAFQGFLLLAVVHEALLQEPMLVFGRSTYLDSFREYSKVALRIHVFIAWAAMLVLGLSAWLVGALGNSGTLAWALAGTALASPGLLLLYLARRAFYARLTPQVALSGALLYAAAILSGVLILYWRRLLSPFAALLLMGLSGLVVGCFLMLRLWSTLKTGEARLTLTEVSHRHWIYGRWALAAAFVKTVPSTIAYYFFFGRFSGLAQVGALKALLNLNAPISQACASFGLLSLPHVAETHHRGGQAGLTRLIWKLAVLYASCGIVYWIFVSLFRSSILQFLYAGKYALVTPFVPWLGLASTLAIIGRAQGVAMRGIQSPFLVFAAYGISGVIDLGVGIPAIVMFGLRGIIFTEIVSSGVALVAGFIMLRKALFGTSNN